MDQILQILIQNGYIDENGAKDLADLSKTESKPIRQLFGIIRLSCGGEIPQGCLRNSR